ncbi:MAG: proprotein convertase P-domain-containing protein, partial [Deltaproteobacteria bacterium]|nr:proprotein convertase P-domain-containing protein [Deltaproteobacteria bacterium]
QDLYWSSVAVGEDLMATKAAKLEVSESALCGDQLSLKLMLQEGGRSAVYRKSFVIGQELIGAVQTFSAEGLPLPIQDRKNTEARLKMTGSEQWPEDARIASARLKFDITHSYQGDLTVHLSAPDGSSFAVYKGEGGGDNVHFDKDLSSLLKGMSGGGVWSLHVKDGAVQDEGTLDAVSLELTPVRYVCQ